MEYPEALRKSQVCHEFLKNYGNKHQGWRRHSFNKYLIHPCPPNMYFITAKCSQSGVEKSWQKIIIIIIIILNKIQVLAGFCIFRLHSVFLKLFITITRSKTQHIFAMKIQIILCSHSVSKAVFPCCSAVTSVLPIQQLQSCWKKQTPFSLQLWEAPLLIFLMLTTRNPKKVGEKKKKSKKRQTFQSALVAIWFS